MDDKNYFKVRILSRNLKGRFTWLNFEGDVGRAGVRLAKNKKPLNKACVGLLYTLALVFVSNPFTVRRMGVGNPYTAVRCC